MLVQLLVCALLVGGAGAPASPEVWVRVERGHAQLSGGGARAGEAAAGAWWRGRGRGELRLEPRAQASLRWSGRASVDLVGPARCRFEPEGESGWRLILDDAAQVYVEARAADLVLELTGGWQARITAGVAALRPAGCQRASSEPARRAVSEPPAFAGLSVERLVGAPLVFERFGPGLTRRVEVRSGGHGFLPAGAPDVDPARPSSSAHPAAWPELRWPWRVEEFDPPVDPRPAPPRREPEPVRAGPPAPAAAGGTAGSAGAAAWAGGPAAVPAWLSDFIAPWVGEGTARTPASDPARTP